VKLILAVLVSLFLFATLGRANDLECPDPTYYLVLGETAMPFIPDKRLMAEIAKYKLFEACPKQQQKPCTSEFYFFPGGQVRMQCYDPSE